jgi:serine/threonine protein kinase/tetratricopeptide (TPR) repeat protein/TolB-like protein
VSDAAGRWHRLRHIMTEASELGPAERGRFVARACAGDVALRRQVDALLCAPAPEDYLVELARRTGLPFVGGELGPPPGLERVGAYRLLRQIGEGGMGAVYLAERSDGDSEMRAAVKLLQAGVHTDGMRRRFAAERRILARLAHPGIGRLLDGGVTGTGVPFLVMEYAPGVEIDVYCDDNRIGLDGRLTLFLEVCAAVEFAHGHGVVHRDLKPSNIMVSADGRMKLLDFGIAKVLDGADGPEPTLTAWGETPLSPSYASPEQLLGEAVGYESDVYQLAALLYLLLTGRLPTDPIGGRSWAECSREVGRRPVVPASLAAGMPGQGRGGRPGPTPEERARTRQTSVAGLRSSLAGSIDAILLKALRREPARRYRSVAELAAEIRRMLHGEHVAAQFEMGVRAGRLQPVDPGPGRRRSAGRTTPPPVPVSARRVVVLPFACAATDDLAYLGSGLMSLFAAALDDSGVVDVVEPAAVLAALAADGAPSLAAPGQPAGSRLARQLGAGLYLEGEATAHGENVRIAARLHTVQGEATALGAGVAEGPVEQLVGLVESLAAGILCAAAPPHHANLAGAAAATTSLHVLKLFMRGEQALHAGAFFAAADAFQSSVEADPDFALGYYRLAMSAYWAHNLGLTRRFAAEAAARDERLAPRERRLLSALQLYLGGHTAAAEQGYAALLEEDAGDLEAAFLLGTLLFFHNPLRGRSQAEARPHFERVLAIQPDHILSLLYLSTLLARTGDGPGLDRLTERLLAAYPDGGVPAYPLVARAQRAFAGDRPAEQDRVLEELRQAGSLAAITAAQVSVVTGRDLSAARRIADLLVSAVEGPEVRATGHVMRAHLELGGGRIAAARRDLRVARGLGSDEAHEFATLFALAPFLATPAARLEKLRSGLLARSVPEPADAPPPIPHFAPHHGVHAHAQLFLLGLLNARLGAHRDALDQARDLEAAVSSSDDIALGSFAATIRAQVAALRSGPAAALEVLEAHELGTSVERALSSSLFAHGHTRFTRAGLLAEVGRHDEALAWYRTLGDLSIQDTVYVAPAQLRQARILQGRGDSMRAADQYRRFLRLWQDCDPALRPVARAALQALAGLNGPAPGAGQDG